MRANRHMSLATAAVVMSLTVWSATLAGETRLVDVVRAGDRNTAIRLLGQRSSAAEVNAAELDGTTPLHWAVHHDDVELAARLLKAGADVKARNAFGATPLSEAAIVANVAMIALLVDAGADVDTANADGQTALMVVARTGNVEAARLLIRRGANVNVKERWHGQTALMWAAAGCLPAMAKELIAHDAEVNVVSTVNQWERDVTAEPRRKYMPLGGWTPLLFAAREGCLDVARVLLENGANPNLQDPDLVSPTIMAIVNGHYDVAAHLIEKGADVNLADRWGRAALWAVVDMHTTPHSARPDVVETGSVTSSALLNVVLAHGADVNAELVLFPPYRSLGDRGNDNMLTIGSTALLRASKAGDIEAIRLLLDRHADPNAATVEGVTPLMAAAGLGSRDSDTRGRFKTEQDAIGTCRMLLDAGAELNATDSRGQMALHGAAFWGWNGLVQLLVDRGARIDAKDRRGMTPVDFAMGRAGGNGFGGNRIDVHEDTATLLRNLMR